MIEPAARPTHRLPVRVYYEDTDASGLAYHAAYLRFAERGRSEFLRAIGWPHRRLAEANGAAWAVHRLEIDYLRPARLDDLLTLVTELQAVRGTGVTLKQVFWCNEIELARLAVRVVLVMPSGRPGRIPPDLRHSIQSLFDR